MNRLLQLNVTANWGSTGKIAEGIGESAISRKWESVIAYGRYMNPSASRLIKVGNLVDVYAHYAKHRLFDEEGLGSRNATRKLIKEIQLYNPSIIHLHNIHDHWLNYPLLFEYLATINTPIVWTFHDCWAFTGGCTHFENENCFDWKTVECEAVCKLKHKCAGRQFKLRKELIGRLGNRLTIVCVSHWMADYVAQSYLSDAGVDIKVLYNGINLNGVFRPGISEKENMILGVANVWNADKGIEDFRQLRKLLPSDVGITLVGLTQKQIDKLPNGIVGIKRTANAHELARLYNRASVFVNPTYNDSFPTVNLEALACGTPVVTYRTGGSPEAVTDKTGILVERGDVYGLVKAILNIIDNPNQFSSQSCRQRAVQEFDNNEQFSKYVNLYEKLMRSI